MFTIMVPFLVQQKGQEYFLIYSYAIYHLLNYHTHFQLAYAIRRYKGLVQIKFEFSNHNFKKN
jgi:hypothetical protein